jgi:hypothetical protein
MGRPMQGLLDDDEIEALRADQDKDRIEKEKREAIERERLQEANKRRKEHIAAMERRMTTIGIFEAILFGAIVGFHLGLTSMQRDYTGFYLATVNFFNSMVGGTDFVAVADVPSCFSSNSPTRTSIITYTRWCFRTTLRRRVTKD